MIYRLKIVARGITFYSESTSDKADFNFLIDNIMLKSYLEAIAMQRWDVSVGSWEDVK